MDTEFIKNYYKYFRWNDALINHFFNENFREIRLTIDKHIIEDIGEKAGIQEICKDADIEFEGCGTNCSNLYEFNGRCQETCEYGSFFDEKDLEKNVNVN